MNDSMAVTRADPNDCLAGPGLPARDGPAYAVALDAAVWLVLDCRTVTGRPMLWLLMQLSGWSWSAGP